MNLEKKYSYITEICDGTGGEGSLSRNIPKSFGGANQVKGQLWWKAEG